MPQCSSPRGDSGNLGSYGYGSHELTWWPCGKGGDIRSLPQHHVRMQRCR